MVLNGVVLWLLSLPDSEPHSSEVRSAACKAFGSTVMLSQMNYKKIVYPTWPRKRTWKWRLAGKSYHRFSKITRMNISIQRKQLIYGNTLIEQSVLFVLCTISSGGSRWISGWNPLEILVEDALILKYLEGSATPPFRSWAIWVFQVIQVLCLRLGVLLLAKFQLVLWNVDKSW